jgi:fructose-1,6-bisphosphatase class II
MKNFHLDLVRVTEAGAISAAEWVGRGDKEAADKAATEAMRDRLDKIDFCAEIAIGEGKKDASFGLFAGDKVGKKWTDGSTRYDSHFFDIAVDPIEGTTPTAKGGYEAMSVIAVAEPGCFFKTDTFYMEKLAFGREIAKNNPYYGPSLKRALEENVRCVAAGLEKPLNHVTVCLLDRPRHTDLVERLRKLGCRIKFISDCDVTACIATCVPNSGIDMYVGVGGAPEAVIAAAAMKCLRGKFQARITDQEGKPLDDRIYDIEDLAKGNVMFAATGITDGQLLDGVQFTNRGPVTHSIAMRSESGTTREMRTTHAN